MRSTLVLVDAAFLSILQKEFGDGEYLKMDIFRFARNLAKKHNLFCKNVFYYTAPPFLSESPSEDQVRRRKGYDNFVKSFDNNKNVTIREGRCQKIGPDYHQKGVDAWMVFDMATTSIRFPDVEKIVLITSDTDFVPIIKEMRKLGVEVLLCTYQEKKRGTRFSVSNHLVDCCESVYFLSKEDFEKAGLEE